MATLFEPLRSRAFRWLEGTGMAANIGVWMVSLFGGFLMERLTRSPVLVSLATDVSPLAGMVAVVFAGAVADSSDRRSVLLLAKSVLVASLGFLCLVAATGELNAASLLVGVAGMGVANGISSPTWWTTVGNLVRPEVVPVAMSIDSFQWNIGQVVGPILGGSLLHGAGPAAFFACCGGVMLPLVAFLSIWRGRSDLRLSSPGGAAVESFLGAMSAGWRFFLNSPGLRAVAARTALYVTPAAALGALLPLFAARYLHTSAFGYGLYLALSGAGAMVAALVLPRLQGSLHLDALVAGATLANAAALAVLIAWPNRFVTAPVLVVTGASWVWSTTTLIIAARQVVPQWVQTRALSIFYIVLMGPFVAGGIAFGVVDTFLPLRVTLLVAAVALVPGVVLIPRFGLPAVDRASLEPVVSPTLTVGEHVHPDDGPVLVLVEYRLEERDVDEFLEAAAELRVVRRRLGATRWGVFEDAAVHGRFLETFIVASWHGYLAQRAHYTRGDLEIEQRVAAFHRGPGDPSVTRLVHPDSVEAARSRSAWRREMFRLVSDRPSTR
ncbi:MAG: MFS transporter [Actinomycetota bacterium]|nr:MFS transporter [Actinomycetota bacterium]